MIAHGKSIRKTTQFELPVFKGVVPDTYDVYPVHATDGKAINIGYATLAKSLASCRCIKIDGYIGTLFDQVRRNLTDALSELNIVARWINVDDALLSADVIDEKLIPFLGGDDPIFGKLCPYSVKDFFDTSKLQVIECIDDGTVTIYYGIGAALIRQPGCLVFFDVPKNEIQFRARAGVVKNFGASRADDHKKMYKRFYFVDWPVLNRYVQSIIQGVDFFVDGQRSQEITWMHGDHWRNAIRNVSRQPIRARPWFEPGVWGGTWIKDKIPGISRDVSNYAWSFELIYPENGLIFENEGVMLETTFDSILFLEAESVLGVDAKEYGSYFPIRFDFLDTFDGGNLSVQCHPNPTYMHKHFGEMITQEETYYMLDVQRDAKVYLGFHNGVTREKFGRALKMSFETSSPLDIDQFVQTFPAKKHDLFLIPPGTVHASGRGCLVLEISSTPYIYTFKMYDWVRLDLDGKPRPLNIDRGMDNLVFERSGENVKEELISQAVQLEASKDYVLYHLPTHKQHLYDVHRYVVKTEVNILTDGKVHVLSLVEGARIAIVVDDESFVYNYAETFVIPAAAKEYTIKNLSDAPVMVVKAFIK